VYRVQTSGDLSVLYPSGIHVSRTTPAEVPRPVPPASTTIPPRRTQSRSQRSLMSRLLKRSNWRN